MTKENIWEDDLIFGDKGEEALKDTLNSILFVGQIERIKYNGENLYATNLQQKAGIDGTIEFRQAKWDIKLRKNWTYKFKDSNGIAIETISNIEAKKPGWWYYSQADWIIYVWADKHEVNIIDGYFIFLQNPILREWFEDNKIFYWENTNEKLRNVLTRVKETGMEWHTENIAIPISDFPVGTVIQFNPNVKLDKQQKTLNQIFLNSEEEDTKIKDTKTLADYF